MENTHTIHGFKAELTSCFPGLCQSISVKAALGYNFTFASEGA